MKEKGKSPLSIMVVILALLLVALGILSYFTFFGDDGNGKTQNGDVLASNEKNGSLVENETGTDETEGKNGSVVRNDPTDIYSKALEEGDKENSGSEDLQPTDVPEPTDEPEGNAEPTREPKSVSQIVDDSVDSAQMSLAYYENRQRYLELYGYIREKNDPEKEENPEDGTSENPDDEKKEEPLVFLNVYYEGTEDRSVAAIQERLMQLGFMEFAEPTEYYGTVTQDAVRRFQRQNDLKQDGIIGEQSLAILFDDNAKTYLLKKGMDGEDVRAIQQRLYELGYLAKNTQTTGHFGDDTDNAVKTFQAANGLTADGKVGVMTTELLYSENVKANLISFGDKSDVVLESQKRLKKLGYLTTEPDGNYGNDTLAAVKLFQSRNDCIVDGYLGPGTRAALLSSDARPNGLVVGDSNDTVKRVQQLLIKYGYLNNGSDTGYFGDITEAAVKKFQSRNGLTADGNVGQMTMAVLTGNNVVKASSGSSGGGNSGGGSSGGGNSGGGNSGGGSGDGGGSVVYYNCSPDDLIKVAKTKLGCKYVWGSKGPNTFDCSGFVYWCLKQIGVKQSYITSYGWRTVGKYKKITSFSNIRKGDIIVVYGHVGIAAGNGEVIDASSSNGKIVHRTMGDWWKRNFICAWRIFD